MNWSDWKWFILACVVIFVGLAAFARYGHAEPSNAPSAGNKGAGTSLICNEAKDVAAIFQKWGDNIVEEGQDPIGEYNKSQGHQVCGYLGSIWTAVKKVGDTLTFKFGRVEIWEIEVTAIDPTGHGRFQPTEKPVRMFVPFVVGNNDA
jgi:hypothetical protein